MENHKIVIAPHTDEYVGKLGINQFADDLSKIMNCSSSWERHWRRFSTPKLETGDIMLFSFKEGGEWYVVGDAILLFDGFEKGNPDCGDKSETRWKHCYHFSGFRLYSKFIPYKEIEENISDFNPDRYKLAYLNPDQYVDLLSLSVEE